METLSCENTDEYFKEMDYEFQSLMKRYTWDIFSRKSVNDQNVLPGTWSFKYKRKPDWTIRKFKAQYCVRRNIQKTMSPKTLNSYSPVVQWDTVRLVLIFQCILGLLSQSIDFKNNFDKADCPSGEPVFIELTRNLKIDIGKDDVVLKLKKILNGQAKAARL